MSEQRRLEALMQSKLKRLGTDMVKLIYAFIAPPKFITELKSFNRHVSPIKNAYRLRINPERRLTKADFVAQWQARVFRVLHSDILRRALNTKIGNHDFISGGIETRYRTKWDLLQKEHCVCIENRRQRDIRSEYEQHKRETKNYAVPEPLQTTGTKMINFNGSYLLIPLIVKTPPASAHTSSCRIG